MQQQDSAAPDRADAERELAERLVAGGLLPADAARRAEEAARMSGATLLHSLTELGLVEEERLARFVADWLGCPFVEEHELPDEPLLREALEPAYLGRARIAPVAADGDGVVFAMADPLDEPALRLLSFHLGRPARRAVATSRTVEAALRRYRPGRGDGGGDEVDRGAAGGFASDDDVARLAALANEGPVIRLVGRLLGEALEAGASDVHVEPQEAGVSVRYRVDGRLREVDRLPARGFAAVASRVKIMARLDIAERRVPQDGRTRVNVRGREVDCRVSTVPTLHGESVVVRLLDRRDLPDSLAGLGFEPPVRERLAGALREPDGIVLVTGPTGSGKTTTLHACLRGLASPERKVFTVEDPVEYRVPGVCQVQVHPQVGLTFACSLRAILRQDPDVVMVGEIRDGETAQIAVRAALTGHLVLSTLHTNSAAGAVTRLADMGVDRYLLAPTLRAIAAQRLVRRPCPACRRRVPAPPPGPGSAVGAALARLGVAEVVEARGCAACAGTGYAGRGAVVELLVVGDAVRAAVLGGADEAEIERAAGGDGFTSLLAGGVEKVRRGETTVEELAAVVRGAAAA